MFSASSIRVLGVNLNCRLPVHVEDAEATQSLLSKAVFNFAHADQNK